METRPERRRPIVNYDLGEEKLRMTPKNTSVVQYRAPLYQEFSHARYDNGVDCYLFWDVRLMDVLAGRGFPIVIDKVPPPQEVELYITTEVEQLDSEWANC